MQQLPRQLLFIFLALIQFVAPLVHAHTNTNPAASYGLHVPGLESYKSSDFAQFLPATNQLHDSEGLVVGVDAGIKQNLADKHSDQPVFGLLPPTLAIKPPPLLVFEVNFSPQYPTFKPQLQFSLHSPRAPPFYASI